MIRNYNEVPGIYQFCNKDNSYVGSSKNLFYRCYKDHRIRAFSKISRHNKFYKEVAINGWESFTLYILDLTPNHVKLYAMSNPNYILDKKNIILY